MNELKDSRIKELEKALNEILISYRNYHAGAISRLVWEDDVEQWYKIANLTHPEPSTEQVGAKFEPSVEEVERVAEYVSKIRDNDDSPIARWHLKTLTETVETLRKEIKSKCNDVANLSKERETALAKLKVCREALDWIWDTDEMGYLYEPDSESGYAECRKCGSKGMDKNLIHVDYCCQGIIEKAFAKLNEGK